MLPKKKKETKKKIKYSIPPFKMAVMKKIIIKSNLPRLHMCQRGGSFPPFQTAGMRKTTKKYHQI